MTFSFARVADYFSAVAALDAELDPPRRRAIAALLGFDVEETVPPVTGVDAPPVVASETLQARADVSVRAAATMTAEPRRRQRAPQRLEYTLTRTSSARRTPPAWLEHVPPLPAPPPGGTVSPAPAPLFAHRWTRAILSTAMSTDTVTNAIDLEAIVSAIARGRSVTRVPRRIIPTLSHGLQLLVDRGPGAAPFLADQEVLIEQIRAVAGHDRVQILRFDPSREFIAGRGPRTRWRDYFALTPPPPGMTIALISDLGIATVPFESSAMPSEWHDFLARLRSRGHRVVAFVPYASSRWPQSLRRLAGMLPWDRTTSVQVVRRVLGRRRSRRQVLR